MKNIKQTKPVMPCLDCGKETVRTDYYMIHDELWQSVEPGDTENKFLCLKCLELRLGRKLELPDFTGAPVNWEIDKRLKELENE